MRKRLVVVEPNTNLLAKSKSQQNGQHIFFPFVLSLPSLLLPRTSMIVVFGASNFLSVVILSILFLLPSQKSRRVMDEGRMRRSLVDEPTMSFTGSPSLSWVIVHVYFLVRQSVFPGHFTKEIYVGFLKKFYLVKRP